MKNKLMKLVHVLFPTHLTAEDFCLPIFFVFIAKVIVNLKNFDDIVIKNKNSPSRQLRQPAQEEGLHRIKENKAVRLIFKKWYPGTVCHQCF
jgi:hypothetical protein